MDAESSVFRNAVLAFFNLGVEKFFHFSALQADQMVVVFAMIEFKHRLVAIEMVAHQQAGLFKLCQYAVHRGQPDVLTFVRQKAINLFRCHVAFMALLEQIKDFQPRQGGLEAYALQVGWVAQAGLRKGNTNAI